MPEVDPSRTSGLPMTRRTVLRTGTRLAYASPLIAASLSLDSVQAAVVVSGAGCGDSPRSAPSAWLASATNFTTSAGCSR